MAAAAAESEGDPFSCELCEESYTEAGEPRVPMNVPCGHSFCLRCLGSFETSNYANGRGNTCPKCRRPFGDVSDLVRNFGLLSAMAILKRKDEPPPATDTRQSTAKELSTAELQAELQARLRLEEERARAEAAAKQARDEEERQRLLALERERVERETKAKAERDRGARSHRELLERERVAAAVSAAALKAQREEEVLAAREAVEARERRLRDVEEQRARDEREAERERKERKEREAIEKAAVKKAARETEDKAERERLERSTREKKERDAKEKVEKEQKELEALDEAVEEAKAERARLVSNSRKAKVKSQGQKPKSTGAPASVEVPFKDLPGDKEASIAATGDFSRCAKRMTTLSDDDSSARYEGDVVDIPHHRVPKRNFHLKHGKGVQTVSDKGVVTITREGMWDLNKFVRGTYKVVGKLTYVGCMADGVYHGKGVLKHDNGHTLAGNFVDGELHGEGKATNCEGVTYVGGFRNGLFHGRGRYEAPDYVYEGEFRDGEKHGQGRMQKADDAIREGRFRDGMMNGIGCIIFQYGKEYSGYFRDGRLDGFGRRVDLGTFEYVGFFRRDKFHGHGRLTHQENGTFYVGEFEDFNNEGEGRLTGDSMHSVGQFRCGKMVGRGVLCNPEAGDFYSGDFLDGKSSGQGWLEKEEYVYVGSFRDGTEHGRGVRILLDDYTSIQSEWSHGDLVCGARVKMTMPDGSEREGVIAADGEIKFDESSTSEWELGEWESREERIAALIDMKREKQKRAILHRLGLLVEEGKEAVDPSSLQQMPTQSLLNELDAEAAAIDEAQEKLEEDEDLVAELFKSFVTRGDMPTDDEWSFFVERSREMRRERASLKARRKALWRRQIEVIYQGTTFRPSSLSKKIDEPDEEELDESWELKQREQPERMIERAKEQARGCKDVDSLKANLAAQAALEARLEKNNRIVEEFNASGGFDLELLEKVNAEGEALEREREALNAWGDRLLLKTRSSSCGSADTLQGGVEPEAKLSKKQQKKQHKQSRQQQQQQQADPLSALVAKSERWDADFAAWQAAGAADLKEEMRLEFDLEKIVADCAKLDGSSAGAAAASDLSAWGEERMAALKAFQDVSGEDPAEKQLLREADFIFGNVSINKVAFEEEGKEDLEPFEDDSDDDDDGEEGEEGEEEEAGDEGEGKTPVA